MPFVRLQGRMDKQEFKKLIYPIRNRLFRLAIVLLGNQQEAEDVLQDVMLKLWNKKQELNICRNVEAFAVTMTRNACFDKLRSYRHRNVAHMDTTVQQPASDAVAPDLQMELSETAKVIHDIIQLLPDQQRYILYLRDIEQYDYQEIEELTGITSGAIRVTLSRARKKVREIYQRRLEYENRRLG